MIRFGCEHCGHKISVQDKHVGKRGKCPECGALVVIPTKSTIITFHCQNCNRKISVPKTYASKEVQCPNCKDRFIVPAADLDIPLAAQSPPTQSAGSDGALTFLDLPKEYRVPNQSPGRSGRLQEVIESERESAFTSPAETAALATERDLPWLIDIFLYPASKPGLKILAIVVVIPLFIEVVLRWLGVLSEESLPVFVLYVPLLIVCIVAEILLYLYAYWYFCECIRDSAYGGVRAPETVASTPGLGGLLWQWFRTIACFIVVTAPAAIYYGCALQTNTVFWALLTGGLFVLPMALLAVITFDSFSGLNPVLLIGSIFSTFFQYCGLVLLAVGIALAARFSTQIQATEDAEQNWVSEMLLGTLLYGIWLYAVFVVAHLIGRFHWRNQEKLNWDV